MSTDHDAHLILHHLDDPLRFLHWTLDEAMAIMIPTFFGLGVDHPLLGLLAAGTFYDTLAAAIVPKGAAVDTFWENAGKVVLSAALQKMAHTRPVSPICITC